MMGGCGAGIFCALAVDRPHRKKTSEIKEIRSFTDICSNELEPKARIVAPVEQKVMFADQQDHRQSLLIVRLHTIYDRSGEDASAGKSRTTTSEAGSTVVRAWPRCGERCSRRRSYRDRQVYGRLRLRSGYGQPLCFRLHRRGRELLILR